MLKVSQLSGIDLDYWMYKCACKVLNKVPTTDEFKDGHKAGLFHFTNDKALLADLMQTYQINIQQLAEEWLASTQEESVFAKTPIEAACRLVIMRAFGKEVPSDEVIK